MKHDVLIPGKMIIDTKYKFRYTTDDLKGSVSQDDVYQMVTYCYKRQIGKGLLFYPTHFDEDANNETSRFKVEASNAKAILIDANSIDITESDFEHFETGQVQRFSDV